jgi:hypothetical protein
MKPIQYCANAIAVSAVLFLGSVPACAQVDAPTKRQNVEYLRIIHLDYKLQKRNEVRGIIDDYFVPASQKAGTPGPKLVLHFQTGEWDTIAVWVLEEGMTELEWTQITPNFVKWKTALDELAGGEEEGNAIMAQYYAAIARSRVDVGHHHLSAN